MTALWVMMVDAEISERCRKESFRVASGDTSGAQQGVLIFGHLRSIGEKVSVVDADH